jgi:hypothetical protein
MCGERGDAAFWRCSEICGAARVLCDARGGGAASRGGVGPAREAAIAISGALRRRVTWPCDVLAALVILSFSASLTFVSYTQRPAPLARSLLRV